MRQTLINYFWHLPIAILANIVYGFPSKKLKVIGVTGTSGKTTTSHLIYHLLDSAGYKAALISTIGAKIGKQNVETGLHVTNPEAFPLQKILKHIHAGGFEYVVLEVTSHGLDQFRTWGIEFLYGVLTNISHEHLDYHKTMARYTAAKLKLIKQAQTAVLNSKDSSFLPALKAAKRRVIEYDSSQAVGLPPLLRGDFNRANVAAAQAVVLDLGVSREEISGWLKTFPSLPGRMELIQEKPFKIFIDFAHKPDALEKVLTSLRTMAGAKGRVIIVFGSAGLRDRLKRPVMGAIAAKLADLTVLTAEDPRTESAEDIIEQIASGYRKVKKPKSHRLFREPDRQKAINLAIKLARPGDVLVALGKSHEKSMCFGKIEYPWSEHQAVLKALKLKKEGK